MTYDKKEETLKAMAAKQAADEAAWHQDNPGRIRLYLVKAEDDPPTFSHEGQTDLRTVIDSLRANKIEADAPFMTLDAADGVGGYTGEITLLVTAFSPILCALIGAWIQSKVGRKVRLKDGDFEVEARTVKEMGQVLDLAQERKNHQLIEKS